MRSLEQEEDRRELPSLGNVTWRGARGYQKLGSCYEFEFLQRRVQSKKVEGKYNNNKLNHWNKMFYLVDTL